MGRSSTSNSKSTLAVVCHLTWDRLASQLSMNYSRLCNLQSLSCKIYLVLCYFDCFINFVAELFQSCCKFKFYLDNQYSSTAFVDGMNPEYKFEKLFKFPKCTSEVSMSSSFLDKAYLFLQIECVFSVTNRSCLLKILHIFFFHWHDLIIIVLKNWFYIYRLSKEHFLNQWKSNVDQSQYNCLELTLIGCSWIMLQCLLETFKSIIIQTFNGYFFLQIF